MAMLSWRSGPLGDAPWPGTDALYWAEVELRAPPAPGLVTLAVRFDAGDLDEPHQDASSPFNVSVVARPDHTLTVKVASGGVPIEDAIIRLGPYRATTDASGRPRSNLATGRYELVVWKAGYDTRAGAAHDRRGCLRRRSRRGRCRRTIPTRSGRRSTA